MAKCLQKSGRQWWQLWRYQPQRSESRVKGILAENNWSRKGVLSNLIPRLWYRPYIQNESSNAQKTVGMQKGPVWYRSGGIQSMARYNIQRGNSMIGYGIESMAGYGIQSMARYGIQRGSLISGSDEAWQNNTKVGRSSIFQQLRLWYFVILRILTTQFQLCLFDEKVRVRYFSVWRTLPNNWITLILLFLNKQVFLAPGLGSP